MRVSLFVFLIVVIISNGSYASSEMVNSEEINREVITSFYEKALTVNKQTTPEKVLDEILADDFLSAGSVEKKTKKQLIGQVGFFWKLVPNLKWEIQEVIKAKNKYVVRSIASGNPQGEFMGLTTDGSKKFQIITVDIHTIENGKIKQTYHVEDWSTAIRQLDNNQSNETMKIAGAFMEAMGKGDMKTMKNLMHDDMVWQNEGDKSLPWIGPWKGKKAILEEFIPLFGKNFKTIKWEPNDAMSSGDTAAFFGRMIGLLTKSNQKTKEFTYALRVKVKDGKIILWNWFEDSYEVSKTYHK